MYKRKGALKKTYMVPVTLDKAKAGKPFKQLGELCEWAVAGVTPGRSEQMKFCSADTMKKYVLHSIGFSGTTFPIPRVPAYGNEQPRLTPFALLPSTELSPCPLLSPPVRPYRLI